MRTPIEIRQVADIRLEEAYLLYEDTYYEGAYYLAGYCVELYLKAKICETLDIDNLFDATFTEKEIARPFKIHKLDSLLWLCGLKKKFEIEINSNHQFLKEWSRIVNWSEDTRYLPKGTISQAKAFEMIDAIQNKNGFLTWIKKY